MGLNLSQILDNCWKRQRIVPKVVKCQVTAFGTGIVVTQGNPASPIIFNIVVDGAVWAVLEYICIPQEAQQGMG